MTKSSVNVKSKMKKEAMHDKTIEMEVANPFKILSAYLKGKSTHARTRDLLYDHGYNKSSDGLI